MSEDLKYQARCFMGEHVSIDLSEVAAVWKVRANNRLLQVKIKLRGGADLSLGEDHGEDRREFLLAWRSYCEVPE